MSNQSIYKITTTDTGYTFTTDLGLEYQAYFIEGGYMLPVPELIEHVKVFGFDVADKHLKFTHDCKVKNTIFYILKAALAENPLTIISFTCDTSNSLERHRKITFSQWYNRSEERSDYIKIDKTVGGVHGSLLFKREHPFKDKIYDAIPEIEVLLFERK